MYISLDKALQPPKTKGFSVNTNKSKIVWEKWVDPFGQDSDESKWTDYDNDDPLAGIEEEFEDVKESMPNKKSVKVIASPMGLIPYTEHTASSKIFNFWTGHTNFNLSNSIIDSIEKVDGVETLDVFTRYRFRVAIGKCFDDSSVMHNINQTIYQLLQTYE